jgi:hypothetical protein
MENSYWNNNGKHEDEYMALWYRLVPAEGKANTKAGEVLRAANWLYCLWYNEGDRIKTTMRRWDVDGRTIQAFCYLYQLRADGLAAKKLMEAVVGAVTKEDYELALEKALDAVIEWASGQPDTPNEDDFLSGDFDGAYDFNFEADEADDC